MIDQQCRTLAVAANQAAFQLLQATTEQKNAWLHACAERIIEAQSTLIEANNRDLAAAPDYGLSDAGDRSSSIDAATSRCDCHEFAAGGRPSRSHW